MDWLNYHHLLYFWLVVREGGVARAADRLGLAHPTVSAQVKQLERSLGARLLEKRGRGLATTEVGRVVFRYADEIFGLGRELVDAVKGRPGAGPSRLVVGVSQAMPKLVAQRVLAPALARGIEPPVRLVCLEDRPDRLLAELASMELDLVIADAPVPPSSSVRAFSHLLGECGVTICGTRQLAAAHRRGFPRSLSGAPMLLPTDGSSLRRAMEMFLDRNELRPRIAGEFEDSALLASFGRDGLGLFPVPSAVERDVTAQHGVEIVGRLPEVRERFYALSIQRRLVHPAVVAIREVARTRVFRELTR